jgi:phosphoenolpyruvate---glycerone phosphotransferase subunit DhaM
MSVGIVLVSHSYELVNGLQALLKQVQPELVVAIAGGTEELGIGTSALKIQRAIEEVGSEDGVVLLFDLGSALLNAELALDLLETTYEVVVCDAPLVEGAYAATIEAGCGSSLVEVVEAAQSVKTIPKIM